MKFALTFSQNAQMGHKNVSIVGGRKLHEPFSGQFTELLAVHVKSLRIDIFETEFFDSPLNPLPHMFFGPAQGI